MPSVTIFYVQPSLRIAAHFGFVKIGSQMDEEDGVEDIYEHGTLDHPHFVFVKHQDSIS